MIEVIEIWQPVKEGGEAYSMDNGKLKRIATLVNGYPHFLENGFCMEKTVMTEEEAENKGLLSTNINKDEV